MSNRIVDSVPETVEIDESLLNTKNWTVEQRIEMKRRGAIYLEQIIESISSPFLAALAMDDLFEFVTARAAAEVLGFENIYTAHNHKCPKDGTVWRHDPIESYFLTDRKPYEESHKCPTCGYEEFEMDERGFKFVDKEKSEANENND